MSDGNRFLLSAQSINKSFGPAPRAAKSSSTSPPTSALANAWPSSAVPVPASPR